MERMASTKERNRPVRIAGASGSASDRRYAFSTFAANHSSDPVDVIIGDWMSEANMASLSAKKASSKPTDVFYERTFIEALSPALSNVAKYGIKVAVNAGASDPKGCCEAVRKVIKEHGLEGKLKVAWIEGDDVLPLIRAKLSSQTSKWQGIKNKTIEQGSGKGLTIFEAWMENADVGSAVRDHLKAEEFENLCTGERLRDWEWKDGIVGAQAYLGGMGIARAFQEGADIVICGRVADASPVIGAAAWWHSWDRSRLQELANAFIAGHLIECSNYVCGGNFTGFKDFEGEKWLDLGYPIAEIGGNGEVIITKQKGTGGLVTTETCKAQLLYEIQGPWYFNSDVTAVVDGIAFEQLSTDSVALKGVRAEPPPPTTKVGITAKGGYQAEVHWFLVGLDIQAKARMLEAQIRKALGDASRFHVLKFALNGTVGENPTDQNSATVDFRVFAQARESSALAPDKFLRVIMDLIMCSYPGGTWNLDYRQGFPKLVQEYFVTLLPQSEIKHVVHMHDSVDFDIAPPAITKTFPRHQPSMPSAAVSVDDLGETVRGPLGWLVHARSGDKGSNANVGFWVRYPDEYNWMRTLLSTETLKELLASEYNGKQIDRFELPNLWAVHFLLHDHLDRSVSCSSTYDFLGKNVAEFLRSRHVDLPKRFLNRGKL